MNETRDPPPLMAEREECHRRILWAILGLSLGWTFMAMMTAALFNFDKESYPHEEHNTYNRDVVVVNVVYVPICLVLLGWSLWMWNGRNGWDNCTLRTRMICSCLIINAWWIGCIIAFFTVAHPIWLAGWLYLGIPAFICVVNQILMFSVVVGHVDDSYAW
ncbi:hypothetical protein P153DRAFT_390289 [Dothidotthia symphoricarpi CBS 119687]|uniref:Uncharacterized protein n=1 Tax=Dothidotthia symphoricarpi CBS 119687 TaxID=1392245 RepID=A0A6A5ZYK1_9PLEO|nr:uncharacterized protein P153DRAFT_390289 [Dothidotthia symphoricarpi CBS 119687]KAF2124822.1 hypothetical protein P153DRAFT_390289 [Dothidotthia symphoricarpi CBS 119687]